MIKIKAHWIIGILLAVFASGCYKDLGNYSYHDINTIAVKLDSSYIAVYGQRFTIQPGIQMTMDMAANIDDTSKYSFEWYIIDPTYIPVPNAKFLLSTKRILDTVLSLKPGSNYPLTFKITDKKTNVKWTGNSLLTVTTSIFEGWLALCDVNGKSRLDMASWDNTSYKLIPSVLDSVASGLSMNGKPINATYCTQTGALGTALANAIYISTSEGTNRIDPETFKWSSNMNIQYDILAPVSSGFVADMIHPTAGQINYLHSADSNLYSYYKPLQINWGATINVVTGETNPFKAAPFIAAPSGAVPYGSIIFDVTNKRFVRHMSSAISCSLMPTTGMTLFNYSNIGMDLVYMAYSIYNGGEVNAVFKNSSTNKFYLAKFTLAATITQTYYAEITGTNIANAELFAVNPDYGYLFYNVGGKVYEYDLGLKKSFLMLDKGASAITVMKFHPFQKNTYQLGPKQVLYNKLVVGSYDPAKPSETAGLLDLYTVPGINGNLNAYLSIPGFGKIKSLTYRER
ncbi:MAG: PKD-like family lipoprotein [Bacteroidota bacterium]